MEKIPAMGHGPAVPANEVDLIKDRIGFTNPNLHRRIEVENEADFSNHIIGMYDGMHSYRTEDISFHDEESTTCEIP